MKRLRRAYPILMALLLVLEVRSASVIQAQGASGTPGVPAAPTAGRTTDIEGKIKAVDPTGNKVLLDDGTQLMIPATVSIPKGKLKEGATVKASYEEKDGQKVVTSMEVKGP